MDGYIAESASQTSRPGTSGSLGDMTKHRDVGIENASEVGQDWRCGIAGLPAGSGSGRRCRAGQPAFKQSSSARSHRPTCVIVCARMRPA